MNPCVMNCQMSDCGGTIDTEQTIPLKDYHFKERRTAPCRRCGRLHWLDTGKLVFRIDGKPAYKEGNLIGTIEILTNEREGGYIARLMEDLSIRATGSTRDEAVSKIMGMINCSRSTSPLHILN